MQVVKNNPPIMLRLWINRMKHNMAKNTAKHVATIPKMNEMLRPPPSPPRAVQNKKIAIKANKTPAQKYNLVVNRVLGFSLFNFSNAWV